MFARQIVVDRRRVHGDSLKDFPVFVSLLDPRLKGTERKLEGFSFTDVEGRRLDHEIQEYDHRSGALKAWVRVPMLSCACDTILVLRSGDTPAVQADAARVWDKCYRLVLHDPSTATPRDSSHLAQQVQAEPDSDGRRWTRVRHADGLNACDALTVEAWVEGEDVRGEGMQAVVSKWEPQTRFDAFDAYDAGHTAGMDTTGFFGAVFDGRYVYFSPQHDASSRHGKVLRYDTHGDFHDVKSWSAYDAGNTDGLNTKGFYGAVYDGRYVYFPPRRNPDGFHSNVLRYDTRGKFTQPGSWEAFDAGVAHSSQSAAFDGRYIYFCPGQETRQRSGGDGRVTDGSPAVTGMSADEVAVASGQILRYDTRSEFKNRRSWVVYDAAGTIGLDTRDFDGAVFDGRYVYFIPLSFGAVLRYDTEREYQDSQSWSAYDAARLGLKRCVGGVFDGRYVYLVPYGDTDLAVRYDTRGEFAADGSWETYRYVDTPGLYTRGYDGAFFDGRYVYYIPYWDGGECFHGVMLRYDTQSAFTAPAGWAWTDAGMTGGLKTVGFNGGATDGRYLYCAAWRDGAEFPRCIVGNGRILRYDTTGSKAAFSLRFCDLGHNGGLTASMPGARFIVNTLQGPVSVSASRIPSKGPHHLAGVYDGRLIRLYLDGELVGERTAGGQIMANDVDVAIGRILHGGGWFRGSIAEVRISSCARSGEWIATQYGNQRDPVGFCRVEQCRAGGGNEGVP